MTNEKKAPKLRFPGFTDAWEQRKLSESAKFSKGNGYSKSDVTTKGIPLVLYGRLYTNYETVISNIDTYSELEKEGSVVSKGGEIIVPASGETAEDISRASVIKDSGVLIGGDLNIIYPSNDIIPSFLALTITYGNVHKEMTKLAQGKTIVHLHNSDLYKIRFFIPSYNEQLRITALFSNIESSITLQQRKCDNLKKLKKCLLQKMFPKNGSNFPELRFPGFTDAWEQRKFSEGVSEIGDGLHGTPIYCENGPVYFVNGNNLVEGKIIITPETKTVDEKQKSSADKSLDDNTILMSINGTIGNLAFYSGENLMLGKSVAYIKVSEFDKKFVYSYLQAPSVQSYFMDSLTGTTIRNLGLKSIREMKLVVPLNIEEQKKIGNYFCNLDNLITLQQRKLESMKQLKKGLLQQMFV